MSEIILVGVMVVAVALFMAHVLCRLGDLEDRMESLESARRGLLRGELQALEDGSGIANVQEQFECQLACERARSDAAEKRCKEEAERLRSMRDDYLSVHARRAMADRLDPREG